MWWQEALPPNRKASTSQRFSGYLGSEFLVCAIHPSGPAQSPYPDFAEVAFPGSRFQKVSWQDCDRHLQVSFITFLEWDKRGNFA
jgi:hypothetical protein